MKQIIIGYGEIGKAIGAVIGEADMVDKSIPMASILGTDYDVMHVCFPYFGDFIKEVERYSTLYSPKHLIIYSTLPIGTTKRIMGAVHSPVEGKHPELELSIRTMERWIACNDKKDGQFFVNYFEELGLRTRLIENTDFTEALKLLSTSEYGINIVFADYKGRVADAVGMDYELTKEWNREYNKLYRNLGMDKRFQKFVLDRPDIIGGHCVVPNAKLLNDDCSDELLEMIIDMGEE